MLQPGQKFAGRYEIVSELGRGGFAVVYRARDRRLGREVALKLLTADGRGIDPILAQRFEREAKAIASLTSPHTMRLLDFGRADDSLYMACELLEGRDLGELLKERRLSEEEATRLLDDCLHSLAEAHKRGLIHRDIKPSNIHVGADGRAKVLDFGLVQEIDAQGQTLTATGCVVGTPRYMSPEQKLGQKLSPATDIYSLGLTFAEAVLGKTVHAGRGMELIRADAPISDGLRTRLNRMTAPVEFDRSVGAAAKPSIDPATNEVLYRRLKSLDEAPRQGIYARGIAATVIVSALGGTAYFATAEGPSERAVIRTDKPADLPVYREPPKLPSTVVEPAADLGPCDQMSGVSSRSSVLLDGQEVTVWVPPGMSFGREMPLIVSTVPELALIEAAQELEAALLPTSQFQMDDQLTRALDRLGEHLCLSGKRYWIVGSEQTRHSRIAAETSELTCPLADGVVQADDTRLCANVPTVFVNVEGRRVTSDRTVTTVMKGESRDLCNAMGETSALNSACTSLPNVTNCSRCGTDSFVCVAPRRQSPMLGLMGKDRSCTTVTTELGTRTLKLLMQPSSAP